jgi:hypothetical protein
MLIPRKMVAGVLLCIASLSILHFLSWLPVDDGLLSSWRAPMFGRNEPPVRGLLSVDTVVAALALVLAWLFVKGRRKA